MKFKRFRLLRNSVANLCVFSRTLGVGVRNSSAGDVEP
jgi:hypothetical protein